MSWYPRATRREERVGSTTPVRDEYLRPVNFDEWDNICQAQLKATSESVSLARSKTVYNEASGARGRMKLKNNKSKGKIMGDSGLTTYRAAKKINNCCVLCRSLLVSLESMCPAHGRNGGIESRLLMWTIIILSFGGGITILARFDIGQGGGKIANNDSGRKVIGVRSSYLALFQWPWRSVENVGLSSRISPSRLSGLGEGIELLTT